MEGVEKGILGCDVNSGNQDGVEQEESPLEDCVHLSDNIFLFPSKNIGGHDNIFEGEMRSAVYGVRPCVIKFAALCEQNVREAEILTKLGSHTNVIAIIQSGTYCDVFEERVYIALDKCHNENLRQYLANRKKAGIEFDLNQAIDFAKQIIVGVMYIHDNNVIHLDIKPSNILISQNLQLIKIADFGLSIVVMSPKSKVFHKHQFGTNGYRPIESFGNGEVSMRTDIFSLGTVLLHLLSNGNDVFGCDEHTFIHNVMNDVTDTSGLLVSNPLTTEHLIKCMISKERRRRPSIWEVSDHPCWRGKEVDCKYEYFADDEIDDDVTDTRTEALQESTSPTDIERDLAFLQRMREMGFNRRPTIAVFDRFTKYLFCVNTETCDLTEIRETNNQMNVDTFRAVTFQEHVYVFMEDTSVYRLEYCDVTATWEKMADAIGYHGDWPPAVASSRAILLVGGSDKAFSRSMSRFYPNLNKWEELTDKDIAFSNSALAVYKENLYCFGGATDRDECMSKAEKLNLNSMEWIQLENMTEPRQGASAVSCKGKFYIVGGKKFHVRLYTCEMYDPELNQWTILSPTTISRAYFRIFAISGHVYAVIGDKYPKTIEMYDTEKDVWKVVYELKGLHVHDSVLLMVSH